MLGIASISNPGFHHSQFTTGDTIDLGRDQAVDIVYASTTFDLRFGRVGFGVERITEFGTRDELVFEILTEDDSIRVVDHIDSNRNGRVDVADVDVRIENGDMVMDIDGTWQRLIGVPQGTGTQHIILEDVASIRLDQIRNGGDFSDTLL